VLRTCKGCGVEFDGGRSDRVWCTPSCGKACNKRGGCLINRVERTCKGCGAEIKEGRSNRVWCTKTCQRRTWRALNPEKDRECHRRYVQANMEEVRRRANKQAREKRAVNLEEMRKQAREKYAANPERVREYKRKRYGANPEKYRKQAREKRLANVEKVREQHRRLYAADPERHREYARRSRIANLEKVRERNREGMRRANRASWAFYHTLALAWSLSNLFRQLEETVTHREELDDVAARLNVLPTDELKKILARGIQIIRAELLRGAAVLCILESRGEKVEMDGTLARMLRSIARGKLLVDVVIKFGGRPYTMAILAGRPVAEQEQALGEDIKVVEDRLARRRPTQLGPLEVVARCRRAISQCADPIAARQMLADWLASRPETGEGAA